MESEATRLNTAREWRELGFYYDRDDGSKTWRIVGSREGLLDFARLLFRYVADRRNEAILEHEHYGPYSYLEIGTWHRAEITDHWIAGTLESLAALGLGVRSAVGKMMTGDRVSFRGLFAPGSRYDLIVEMRSDDFDPAQEDP